MRRRKRVVRTVSGNMTDVSSILKRSFKKLKIDVSLWEYKILNVWNDVVGKNIARKAQPFRVIGSTLYVKVSSAPWMQELNFMKEGILVKLNERLEGKKVKEIIFKLGRWDERTRKTGHKRPPWMDIRLDKTDEDSLKKEVLYVKDPELREVLFRIRTLERRLKIFKKRPSLRE